MDNYYRHPDFFYTLIPIECSFAGANDRALFNSTPKYFKEPIAGMAYPQTNTNKDKADSKYLAEVIALVPEEKQAKAVEMMALLLSRQALNPDYYRIIIESNIRSGIKEEEDFYSTLLEIITNKICRDNNQQDMKNYFV